MSTTDWLIYAGIVAAALIVGLVLGQVVQYRVRRGLYVPGWATLAGSRQAAAVLLSAIAILTVLSSLLTSFELNRTEERRAEETQAQQDCLRALVDRIGDRTQISDADHRNTTLFIEKLQAAIQAEGLSSPVIVQAAERYLERQERLEGERIDSPIPDDACR